MLGKISNQTSLFISRKNTSNFIFVQLGVDERFFNGHQRGLEKVVAQLFEAGSRDARVEIDSVVQRIDLDAGLRRRRNCPFRPLARGAQPPHSALVRAHVRVVLPLKLLHEEVHHAVVEILTWNFQCALMWEVFSLSWFFKAGSVTFLMNFTKQSKLIF